jgi:hypothetical protein
LLPVSFYYLQEHYLDMKIKKDVFRIDEGILGFAFGLFLVLIVMLLNYLGLFGA